MRWALALILAGGLGVAAVRAGWGTLSSTRARGPAVVVLPAAKVAYDASQDRTVFATGPLRLGGGFTASASFAVSGRVSRGTPLVPGVVLTIEGPLDVQRSGTGEIVDVGVYYAASMKQRIGRVARDGGTASVALEPAAFAALSGAEDAAVKVGSSTIELTPDARGAFRSLSDRCGGK